MSVPITGAGFYWASKTGSDLWLLQILGASPYLRYIAWMTGALTTETGSDPTLDGFQILGVVPPPAGVLWDSASSTWGVSNWVAG